MQYLILAHDANDDGALDRRMKEREGHLATIAKYKASGNMHIGAAILDDGGKMIGSAIIAEFDTPEGLQQWLSEDPYVTGKVWEKLSISPCKIAPSFVPK